MIADPSLGLMFSIRQARLRAEALLCIYLAAQFAELADASLRREKFLYAHVAAYFALRLLIRGYNLYEELRKESTKL